MASAHRQGWHRLSRRELGAFGQTLHAKERRGLAEGYTTPVTIESREAESLTKPPREPFHKGMRKLETATDGLREGIDAKSWDGMPDHIKAIVGSSDKQIALWGVIAAKARRIQELAEKRDAAAIEPEYKAMIAKCIACHASKVATPRDFLNPLPWPG